MSISISRQHNLTGKILFVDGLPGCGKTLFSAILSTLERTEMLGYSYEIEQYCQLHYLGKLPIDAASSLIKLSSDLKLYDSMMGRNVNFRPSDLSSVFQSNDPIKYIRRLIQPGDEVIPDIIRSEQPILNLSTHNLLAFSEPVFEAFSDQCIFVEIVRHPIYMIKQQYLNMSKLIGTERSFTIHFSYNGEELPYYSQEWKSSYLQMSPMDRVIFFIDYITKKTEAMKKTIQEQYKVSVCTVPFEQFVLDPGPTIEDIAKLLETNTTRDTLRVMSEQNVPRSKIADGIDVPIYRRCGWEPSLGEGDEKFELNKRRDSIREKASSEMMDLLDKLSYEYEKKYWTV
jgi:hypothetical protein